MALFGDFGEHEHIFSPVSLSGCLRRVALMVDTAKKVGEGEQGRILATFARGKEDRSE
jgi:hypothetical protein